MTTRNINEFMAPRNLKTILVRELKGLRKADMSLAAYLHTLPQTDMTVARLLGRVFGEDLLNVAVSASRADWYYWDSTIWAHDPDGKADVYIVDAYADALNAVLAEIAGDLPSEVDPKTDPTHEAYKSVRGYSLAVQNEKTQAGVRKKFKQYLQKGAGHFDNDAQWVVFADGQVLDTANPGAGLMTPSAARPVSRKMNVTLGEGKPERWLKSLEDREIPAEQQQYLKIAAGAALLGRGDAKNIVTLVGVSNTGKSSYIETLLKAFGGYSAKLPAGAIVAKTSTNFEQHKARGARFIYLEEPYEARTDDSFLKDLSGGGGLVSTQQKGRDVVEWRPQGVLHIGANHVPKINTQDDAIVKRMNIVGFNRQFTAGDGTFHKNIHAWLIEQEGPQIARWIVEGAIEYDRLGFIPVPDSVRDNAAANVAETSAPVQWLLEKFEDKALVDCRTLEEEFPHSRMMPSTKELYEEFRMWCFGEGVQKVPMKKNWQAEINYYMGEPVAYRGKRVKGSARLWNVAGIKDVPELALNHVIGMDQK